MPPAKPATARALPACLADVSEMPTDNKLPMWARLLLIAWLVTLCWVAILVVTDLIT